MIDELECYSSSILYYVYVFIIACSLLFYFAEHLNVDSSGGAGQLTVGNRFMPSERTDLTFAIDNN